MTLAGAGRSGRMDPKRHATRTDPKSLARRSDSVEHGSTLPEASMRTLTSLLLIGFLCSPAATGVKFR